MLDGGDGRSVHFDDLSSWFYGLQVDFTKIKAKDPRRFKLLYDDMVDDLGACNDFNNKVGSFNDVYCFRTRVSNVRYAVPFLFLSP